MWDSFDSKPIQAVFNRWKKVLTLIIADCGDNKLVDKQRGKDSHVPLVLPRPSDWVEMAADDDDGGDVEDAEQDW